MFSAGIDRDQGYEMGYLILSTSGLLSKKH